MRSAWCRKNIFHHDTTTVLSGKKKLKSFFLPFDIKLKVKKEKLFSHWVDGFWSGWRHSRVLLHEDVNEENNKKIYYRPNLNNFGICMDW